MDGNCELVHDALIIDDVINDVTKFGHCAEESAHLRLGDWGLDGELPFDCQGAQMDVLLNQ